MDLSFFLKGLRVHSILHWDSKFSFQKFKILAHTFVFVFDFVLKAATTSNTMQHGTWSSQKDVAKTMLDLEDFSSWHWEIREKDTLLHGLL